MPDRRDADLQAAARTVARRLAGVAPLRRAVEGIGAHTVADQLDRLATGGQVAAIALPALPHDLRSHRVKMWRADGHDQVAMAFADGGWLAFERPLPSLLRQAVAAGTGATFDVGANTGFYSLLAAATAPRRPVYAFEPLPAVIRRLEANLELNAMGDRVEVVPSAVGDADGEAKLFVPEPTGEVIETSASLNAEFKERHAEVLVVPLTTLDTFWDRLGSPPVGVVKVDVEGFEHAVLAGAARLLTQARPIVFFEVLPGSELEELEALRQQVGYVDARLGARQVVIGRPIAFDPDGWNHALVPAERTEELAVLAGRAGLAHTWA